MAFAPHGCSGVRPRRRFCATALAVHALLAALPACWHDTARTFDPQRWKATSAEAGKSTMAHDFETRWAWQGASRAQLIAWLGEPDRDEYDARWSVGDPCPASAERPAQTEPLLLEIWWTDHQTGAQLELRNRCGTWGVTFSPEAWAAADTPTRSGMFRSMEQYVKSMQPVELTRLREIFGEPMSAGNTLTWCVNDAVMDWSMMTISMASDGADCIQFWEDR
jgi:hypothetical protein